MEELSSSSDKMHPSTRRPTTGITAGGVTSGPSSTKKLEIVLRDGLLKLEAQRQLYDFVADPGWKFGWKSHPKTDGFSFWHKHFAGTKEPDHSEDEAGKAYDCAIELEQTAPIVSGFWKELKATLLKRHTLVRCYANAFNYGCDGTLHTDSKSSQSFTCVYYPCPQWNPNWGGETVLFNADQTDIIASIYPKPNRLVMFPGVIPHLARGLSRSCPVLRISLMFKTEINDDQP